MFIAEKACESQRSGIQHCGTLSSLPFLVGIRWRHFVTEGAVRLSRSLGPCACLGVEA